MASKKVKIDSHGDINPNMSYKDIVDMIEKSPELSKEVEARKEMLSLKMRGNSVRGFVVQKKMATGIEEVDNLIKEGVNPEDAAEFIPLIGDRRGEKTIAEELLVEAAKKAGYKIALVGSGSMPIASYCEEMKTIMEASEPSDVVVVDSVAQLMQREVEQTKLELDDLIGDLRHVEPKSGQERRRERRKNKRHGK